LMDELIEAADADEWEVARILDVLVGLNIAAIEKQRGNTLRNSRAFAYRTGYALSRPVNLHTLSGDIAAAETSITERIHNIKALKAQLEQGKNDTDVAFLRTFRASKKSKDESTEHLDKVM